MRRRVPAPAGHRGRRISAAALLLFLAGCGTPTGPSEPAVCTPSAAAAERPVVVEVPEVYELANVILALTDYQTLAPHTVLRGPYLDQVLGHFGGLRNHALIEALNARLTAGGIWNYDPYYGFRENSFVYDFGANGLTRDPAYPALPWAGSNVFAAEIGRVQDFANRSGFRAFYAEQAPLYAAQVQDYAELVAVDRIWLWLESRFPDRYDRYRIVFSPLINGSHSTQRFTTGGVRETVMFIAGPAAVPASQDRRIRTAQLERLVFTEIDHNYVNPATDRYEKAVKHVFDAVDFWNSDPDNYRSPIATFNEYMTWAAFTLYAHDTYDAATAEWIREAVIEQMVRYRRFRRFREFEKTVMEAYLRAGPVPCLPNLYGEILDRAAALR